MINDGAFIRVFKIFLNEQTNANIHRLVSHVWQDL